MLPGLLVQDRDAGCYRGRYIFKDLEIAVNPRVWGMYVQTCLNDISLAYYSLYEKIASLDQPLMVDLRHSPVPQQGHARMRDRLSVTKKNRTPVKPTL